MTSAFDWRLPALAMGIVGLAFSLSLGGSGRLLSVDWGIVGLALAGAGAAFLALRRLPQEGQKEAALLLASAVALAGVGLSGIERLDPALAWRQAGWLLGGLLSYLVAAFCAPWRMFARFTYLWGLAGVTLLLLTLFFGVEVGGARSWLAVGPLRFQPGEFVKILLVLFLAGYLTQRRQLLAAATRRLGRLSVPEWRHAGPLLVMWGWFLIILIVQRDLGAASLLFGVAVAMLYFATGRKLWLGSGLLLTLLGAAAAFAAFGHVRTRFLIWFDPWSRIDGGGYQIVQSLFALGAGGLFGTGLGFGEPQRIPVAVTDFIFSALGEEIGFVGLVALLLAYAVIVACGFRAAAGRDSFRALAAAGIAALFGLQGLLITGGVTRLVPLTGVTLPFVSYGGSSMLASFLMLGLLASLNRSDNLQRERFPESPEGALAIPSRPLQSAWKGFAAGLVILSGWLAYWQVWRAPELANHARNPRRFALSSAVERGTILDRNGAVLAKSVPVDGSWQRRYFVPAGLAPLLGYADVELGLAGLEAAYNPELSGAAASGDPAAAWEALLPPQIRPRQGMAVRTTLDARLSAVAARALGNRRGAVVAVEPASGEILVAVSGPGFDPNRLARDWRRLVHSQESPLLNRALSGLYPPGSAFKPVVLAAALASGRVQSDTIFPDTGELVVDGYKFGNDDGKAHGSLSPAEALVVSSNVIYAQIGLALGAAGYVEAAKAFGVGEPTGLRVPAASGRLPAPGQISRTALAELSFGQGPLLVSPLEMAVIAATIGNGGLRPKPRLIAGAQPGTVRAVDAATARQVTAAMVDVVERGTGRSARIPGVAVAGKTGTAENPHGASHAWFIAFAPAEAPRLAVAVVVENGGYGAVAAAPIARAVLAAALQGRASDQGAPGRSLAHAGR